MNLDLGWLMSMPRLTRLSLGTENMSMLVGLQLPRSSIQYISCLKLTHLDLSKALIM